jgi:hypothetical protein
MPRDLRVITGFFHRPLGLGAILGSRVSCSFGNGRHGDRATRARPAAAFDSGRIATSRSAFPLDSSPKRADADGTRVAPDGSPTCQSVAAAACSLPSTESEMSFASVSNNPRYDRQMGHNLKLQPFNNEDGRSKNRNDMAAQSRPCTVPGSSYQLLIVSQLHSSVNLFIIPPPVLLQSARTSGCPSSSTSQIAGLSELS